MSSLIPEIDESQSSMILTSQKYWAHHHFHHRFDMKSALKFKIADSPWKVAFPIGKDRLPTTIFRGELF